jgi:hypothetical protein
MPPGQEHTAHDHREVLAEEYRRRGRQMPEPPRRPTALDMEHLALGKPVSGVGGRCGACRFWAVRWDRAPDGHCCLGPPRQGASRSGPWPETKAWEFCGAFEHMPEEETARG